MKSFRNVYLAPSSENDTAVLLPYDSLKTASDVSSEGYPIFKAVRIGKINKKGKFIPIKRRKK